MGSNPNAGPVMPAFRLVSSLSSLTLSAHQQCQTFSTTLESSTVASHPSNISYRLTQTHTQTHILSGPCFLLWHNSLSQYIFVQPHDWTSLSFMNPLCLGPLSIFVLLSGDGVFLDNFYSSHWSARTCYFPQADLLDILILVWVLYLHPFKACTSLYYKSQCHREMVSVKYAVIEWVHRWTHRWIFRLSSCFIFGLITAFFLKRTTALNS